VSLSKPTRKSGNFTEQMKFLCFIILYYIGKDTFMVIMSVCPFVHPSQANNFEPTS